MTTSKMFAGLIGPTLVAIAAAIFCLNLGVFPALAEQVSRDPALIFVSGVLLLVPVLPLCALFPRTGQVPPVDPLDLAAVACAVLTNPRQHERRIYELTGPELLTVPAMVQILSTALERRIRYIRVPTFIAALFMRRFGLSRELVSALVETLGAWRRNEYADVSDAVEQVTGCRPRNFESWCRAHRASFESAAS